jgi:predicted metalloprotease with PDZ domain
MAAAQRYNMRSYGASHKIEISDQIQDFMSDTFIGKAKRIFDHAVLPDDKRIFVIRA